MIKLYLIKLNRVLTKSPSGHFIDALIWVTGAALFGLSPFVFLHLINWMSEDHIADKELEQLADIKYMLFVCCAITGAVLIDFFRSEIKLHGWLIKFAIYVTPFVMLVYVFLKYLLLYIQLDDQHDFGPGNTATKLTVVFGVLYSLLTRTIFNIKSENAGRTIDL